MATVLAARTRETVSNTGSVGAASSLTLTGATGSDLDTFADSVGAGNSTAACLVSGDGTHWMQFWGTVGSGTLTIDTVINTDPASGGSTISLSGTSRVFGIVPSDFSALLNRLFGVTFATTPSISTDVARFLEIMGSRWKQGVGCATAAALATNTYANGSSGVGATLTATANGAIAVDGLTLTVGDTVLVKNEATASHNGIYQVTQTGDASHPYILTRVSWYDQGTGASIFSEKIATGDIVPVNAGTTNGLSLWMQTTTGAITVGSSSLTFKSLTFGNVGIINGLISAVLDQQIGSTQGNILYRGSSAWQVLAPGTSGQVLQTNGAGANPSWGTASGGSGSGLFSGALSAVPTISSTGLSNSLGSPTVTDTTAGVLITGNSAGRYTTSVPSTPYSITALVGKTQPGGVASIGWTDGTKIHLGYNWNIYTSGSTTKGGLHIQGNNNVTTFTSAIATLDWGFFDGMMWWKIQDDGTNVKWYASKDGINFFQVYTVAKSSGFLGGSGYTHIFVGFPGGSGGCDMEILSWAQGV